MIVGTLEVEFQLDGCRSLKDKRRILRSLIDRLRRDFHASVAEVEDNDLWTSAVVGVAVVGREARQVESALQKIVHVLDGNPESCVTGLRREIERT